MTTRAMLVSASLVGLVAALVASPAAAGEGSGAIRLDALGLDRVVAGATYGISGEARADGDGSLGSSSNANVNLQAQTDGNAATASGVASAIGTGVGDNPQASSRANVQVSGPFDRVYRRELRQRFGGRWFQVDSTVVVVVAVKLPSRP